MVVARPAVPGPSRGVSGAAGSNRCHRNAAIADMAFWRSRREESVEADERLALVLEQAQRAITQQQHDLDNLRARAGTLVAAASLVSGFLGAETLRDSSLPAPALVCLVVALVALAVALLAAGYILHPRVWMWGIDVWALLRDYVEPAEQAPASLDELRRDLAWFMQRDVNRNNAQLTKLFRALTIGISAIGVEVVAWTLALAFR